MSARMHLEFPLPRSSPARRGRKREFGESVSPPLKPAGYAKPAVDGWEGERPGFPRTKAGTPCHHPAGAVP
jgi:hypothetical protein